jgi:cytochrome c biogenesis protein CcmG, thiol:disulfide interchange protein DsbE
VKIAAIAMALAVAGCSSHGATQGTSNSRALVGHPAPAWSEVEVPKGTLSLASLRGKAIYLNFFATWCPPCNEEAPAIDRLQRRYGPLGLQVVGVDVLENARKAETFRSQHHLSYPAIVDDGTLRDQYSVNGLPVHVFIDRRGVVRRIVIGELSAGEMRSAVVKLLQAS